VDHKTAVQSLATERYILDELSAAERDEFEEHLSDCRQCMEDVSNADMFVANARAVFADQAVVGVPQRKRLVRRNRG
jgi:anti-sigma factor RsiW